MIHRLREDANIRYSACVRHHLSLGLDTKKVARLTGKDVRTSSTASHRRQ